MKKAKQRRPKNPKPQTGKMIRQSSSHLPISMLGAAQRATQNQHIVAGAAFLKQREPDRAERCFRKVLKANPGNFDALNLMGVAFHQQGRNSQSIGYFKKALTVHPQSANAHINLGNALKALGDFDAARVSYVEALRIQPYDAQTHRDLSTIKKYIKDDPQIAPMLKVASSASASENDRMHINFALGKAYDDVGEFDKAFYHFAAGNKLRNIQQGYDIERDRILFRTLKSIPWKQLQKSYHEDMGQGTCKRKPVFLVGMLRSGTTLVEQVLASHSQVHGAGELELLPKATIPTLSTRHYHPSQILTTAKLETIRKTYCSGLIRMKVTDRYITDKMPLNFRLIGIILSTSPNAKIIHVRRDARATCWSIFRHFFVSGGNGYAYDLKDIAEYYKLYANLMSFWKEMFPGQIYDLCYESLTENQEEQSRRLMKYCGLDWEAQCLEFHKLERAVATASTTQVRQEMYKGSSDRWRKYETHLQPLTKNLEGCV
ncbi:MAG: tetratricopeptide repeat-containing sulfotransferase family protein [Alphaproteobacteria bacterium]